jgi:hypothetical protein
VANQVLVDELAVTMELKNNGIMLRVNTGGRLRGYLQISRGGIRWFRGKKAKPSGEMSLENLIDWAENSR